MSFDRRTYAREYARTRSEKRWAARAASAQTCPRALNNRRICGWTLTNRVINGATVPHCEQCARKAAGVCLDCQRRPVVGAIGKSLRCTICRKLAAVAAGDSWRARHPARVKKQWTKRKRKLNADPETRAAYLMRKKAWRLANPTKRKKYAARYNSSISARTYQKTYRERGRGARAADERQRYADRRAGIVRSHACLGCGAGIVGRAKKCEACRGSAYRDARAILFAQSA